MKKLNIKTLIIFFSFLFFFISTLYTNFGYLNKKEYPNGYDNHFSYLIKSINFKYCFFENSCKGLETIENQFIENQKTNNYNHQTERFSAQVFKIYHPFYSLFIVLVDQIFNDILKSRIFSHLIFLPIIGISIFLFSKKLFGYKVSCFLLILFSFNNYHGWGYGSQINPFVLSQSFSMISFLFMLNSSYLNSSIFSLFCSLTHPIGIFTNLINIFYVVFKKFKKYTYRKIIFLLINIFLICYIYFNNSSFYNEIIIGNTSIFAKDISLISLMVSNVDKFFYSYEPMIKYYGLPLLLICTAYFILRCKDRDQIFLSILIILMAIGTMILDKPNVTLPQRFMNLSGIILLGSFFYTFLLCFQRFLKNISNLKIKSPFYSSINLSKSLKTFSFLSTYLTIIFILVFFSNIVGGLKYHFEYHNYFKINQNVSFSKKQLNQIPDESIIIFDTFEKADYFYLLHGVQKSNYLYYEKMGLNENIFSKKNPKFFVKMANLYEKNIDSDLFIGDGEKIIFDNKHKEYNISIDIYKNSEIYLNDNLISLKKSLFKLKQNYTFKLINGENILKVNKGKLKLISYNNNSNLNWPWNEDLTLKIIKKNKSYKIKFIDNLNKFNNCDTKIVNDEGSSFLFEIINC